MRTLTQTLNSDLGGTEMSSALQLALKQLAGASTEGARSAIILVTDGAVQAKDSVFRSIVTAHFAKA